MKTKIIFISLILLLLDGYAQVREVGVRQYYKQGDIEFSFFMDLGNKTRIVENSSTEIYMLDDTTYSNSYSFKHDSKSVEFIIGASVGYYIIDGLSIEPELGINLTDEGPSVTLIGNLCYTFYVPMKSILPYLKIGYGWGKYDNEYNYPDASFESNDYKIINGSVGLKFKYSSSLALRIEANYRNLRADYSIKNEYIGYSDLNQTKISNDIFSLSFGIYIII